MRKIKLFEILNFSTIILILMALSTAVTYQFNQHVSENLFIDILVLFFIFYFFVFVTYKILITFIPHPSGEIFLNSKEERLYNFYLLWWLIFFNQIFRSLILPTPLHTYLYKFLGAKIGNNSFTAGIIFDPTFVEIGDNVLIGHGTLLTPHLIVKDSIFYSKIKIGNNVSIGVNAVLYSGVVIEDGGQVMAGSIVRPNTIIYAYEVYGGVPAKKIELQNNLVDEIREKIK